MSETPTPVWVPEASPIPEPPPPSFVESLSDTLQHLIQVVVGSQRKPLVRLFARRFTVQERIGQQIADTLDAMLQPHGVAVYLEAHHLCTQMRGVREITPLTRTTFWRGEYDSNASLRAEFFDVCGVRQ